MRIRRVAVVAFTLALVVVGAAVLTNVVPYRQIVDQRRQVAAATSELEGLRSENALLAAQRDSLQRPVEIERLAREKLGYVRPGEVGYVVLEPPANALKAVPTDETGRPVGEGADSATSGALEVVEDESLLETVWDFITGADLSE